MIFSHKEIFIMFFNNGTNVPQQKKQINLEKNFFHNEKFEYFSVLPGKGTAKDEKEKDKALT